MSLQEANAFVSAKIESASPDSDADYNGYLYYDTLEIIEGLQNYPAYLESIQTNAENMTAVSIWGGQTRFPIGTFKNAVRLYCPCWNHTGFGYLSWHRGFAVQSLDGFLGGAVAILLRLPYFLRDREQGILPLLYATPNGRLRLMSCKLGIAVLCAIGLVLLFMAKLH